MKIIFSFFSSTIKPLKIQWQIFFWKPNMMCFKHANPEDYNANWFAASECSGHCQLLATIKCYCVPSLSLSSPVMLWMVPSASLTPCLRVGDKSPPLPLVLLWPCLSRDASQAAPFPVLLVTQLLLSFCGPGAGPAASWLSELCLFLQLLQLCASLPLAFFHRLSHHRCSRELLHFQHLESWSKSYCLGQLLVFSFAVLILQIINLNEEGSDFPLSAALGPLLHSKRPTDKHCM